MGLSKLLGQANIQFIEPFLIMYSILDMLDSMDSLVDRNESPSEPFPGYAPQTAPIKTAAPTNGKIDISFVMRMNFLFTFIILEK